MKRFRQSFVVLAAIVLVAVAGPALAHGTSVIQGIVVDTKHDQPLMGASISAFAARTRLLQGVAHSAKDGSFRISGLAAGEYRLFVTKLGYRSVEVSGLTVDENDHMIIGFPIALDAAPNTGEDPLQVLARCNNLVDPGETSDVYVVCGGH
jgi:Carboxypeptidase regulatory-like domain